jgi:hypothetical protein
MKAGKRDMQIFQIDAPVNDATIGEKEKFWKVLRDVIDTKKFTEIYLGASLICSFSGSLLD